MRNRAIIRKIVIVFMLAIFGTSLFGSMPFLVEANNQPDFIITTNYKIIYDGSSDFVTIEEEVILKSNNSEYYYPAGAERKFVLPDFDLVPKPDERGFKLASLKVEDKRGLEVDVKTEIIENGIQVTVPAARDVTFWNQESFKISYNTHELINMNGNVVNLYIPGLPVDTTFESIEERYGIKTKYIFNTTMTVPSDMPESSFLSPEGITKSRIGGNTIYTIDQNDRVGKTSWIQLGTSQYFYFKVRQPTPRTDFIIPETISQYSTLISTNIFELPLPKEHPETNQKVYISKVTPEPIDIRLDIEGNYIARFEVPANKDGEIIIEGYITLENSVESSRIPDMSLNEYKSLLLQDQYLTQFTWPDNFWQSDSAFIMELAQKNTDESDSVLEIVEKLYYFIIEDFDYSYEKVEGSNDRLGALAALQGAPAVCMEYSDAMIALLRAKGIAARAAIGYGNDPTGAENEIGDATAIVQNIGHQWVQVWIPEYGWLSVDPTWGESGRRYIGANLDHILWYTVGSSDVGYVGTSLSSADPISSGVLSSYDVSLKTLTNEEFSNLSGLIQINDLALDYSEREVDELSLFLKTTSIGKVIVIATPVILLFFGLLIVTSIFSTIIRFLRRPKRSSHSTQLS